MQREIPRKFHKPCHTIAVPKFQVKPSKVAIHKCSIKKFSRETSAMKSTFKQS